MSTNNPFDFTKAFEQFDPQQVAQKIQEAFKFDFDAMKSAQDKNMELLMASNKAIVENSQAMLERQASLLQEAMEEATKAAKSLAESTSAQEAASKQAEMLQAAYEKAVSNSTEISEMAQKTQAEIAEQVNKRVTESLREFKDALAKIA